MRLIDYKKNQYSQNGEDGIIEEIFKRLLIKNGVCCEFGAWDGEHYSNTKVLIERGWKALMIECDPIRYRQLCSKYIKNEKVVPVNKLVMTKGRDTLDQIIAENGFGDIDLLSIDIDGLDYEIFESLNVTPKVICVEINAGHSPENKNRLNENISRNNVGQSLALFHELAVKKGYDLVCYNGNGFFVRSDINKSGKFKTLDPVEAYKEFLHELSDKEKGWLYLVNKGMVTPFYLYQNKYLTGEYLNLNVYTKMRYIFANAAHIKFRKKN